MFKELTIIICATNIEQANNVCTNVIQTSGLNCDTIIYNNIKNEPISVVYNKCLNNVKTKYVLFAHQDVMFVCKDYFKWGYYIIQKLNQKNSGAIGFAGANIRFKADFGGWEYSDKKFYSINVIQLPINNSEKMPFKKRIYHSTDKLFDPVVTLDGLSFFVKTELAKKFPFDEKFIRDFHCYDLDFSITLFKNGYINYVATYDKFSIIHYSKGNYNRKWALTTMNIVNFKWNDILPLSVNKEYLNINYIDELYMRKQSCISKLKDK